MDMKMTMGAGGRPDAAPAPADRTRRGANASELDVWLEKAEAMGELGASPPR